VGGGVRPQPRPPPRDRAAPSASLVIYAHNTTPFCELHIVEDFNANAAAVEYFHIGYFDVTDRVGTGKRSDSYLCRHNDTETPIDIVENFAQGGFKQVVVINRYSQKSCPGAESADSIARQWPGLMTSVSGV
jgi:hypothetical protein